MRISAHDITEMDLWLDRNVSERYKEEPLAQHWARISKMAEEVGEAIQAFIGVTGQNPRKGSYGTMRDVLNEAADVVITGVLCIQHFTGDAMGTADIIEERMIYRMGKAGLTSGK